MDPQSLQPTLEFTWLWVVAPVLALTAVVLTVTLRAPQILRVVEAFRALRSHDPKADGVAHPASSVALSTVAAYGGAAAVGSATAVALGGAGAIAWVWLFAIVLAPLRMAEATLARSAPPGKAGEATGSLAGRLLQEGGLASGLGWALLVLAPLLGFAYYGGVHGESVRDAAEQLLPGSALTLGLVVAAAGIGLALVPKERSVAVLGWTGAIALIALFGAGLVAFFSEGLGHAVTTLSRAFADATSGATRSGAFTGALTGEIALAAMLHILPPLASSAAVEGALHADAQAATTRRHVASALLIPLAYALLTTVVGLSLVATHAFSRPIESTRAAGELTFYRVGFDSVSQRGEESRLYDGFIRVTDGETGPIEVNAGTERGMVRTPTWEDGGEPAELAVHVGDGRIDNLQKPGTLNALVNVPFSELDDVRVRGRMLPRGGQLLAASMSGGGGDLTSRVALAALLLLAAIGAAAWGLGIARILSAKIPAASARWVAFLPGLGLALAASGVLPGFGAIGSMLAAVGVVVGCLALLLRARAAGELTR